MESLNGNRDPKLKIVEDYATLARAVDGLRAVGHQIVVTIGSWDLLHIGHVRYLRKAREQGDLLVVGVDTDESIKKYKGEHRPVVPYVERCEMLTYQSCVDFVTKVHDVDEKGKWQYELIRLIKPDVFVAVEGSYPPEQVADIQKHAARVVVLPRQAENTSTTQMIQFAVKRHMDKMYELLNKRQ